MNSDKAVFQGNYSDLKFIRTRGVCQIVVEIPLEDGQRFVAAFGAPSPANEVPVVVARLNTGSLAAVVGEPGQGPAAVVAPAPTPKRAWADVPYAEQAGIRCSETRFHRFLESKFTVFNVGTEGAIQIVRERCNVETRADIKKDTPAGVRWNDMERAYQAWLNAPAFGAMA